MYLETQLWKSDDFMKQYLEMMYHSVLSFSSVELGPRTGLEILSVSVLFLISSIVNANIFGQFAVLLEALNRKEVMAAEEFDNANNSMAGLGLPDDLR